MTPVLTASRADALEKALFDTVLTVITVCAPLFAMVAFGALLKRTGALSDEAHRFVTGLVYRYSLPVLVFTGVCKTDFQSLLNPAVIVSTLGSAAVLVLLCWAGSHVLARDVRGPVITVSYLGNLSYLGFPLAMNAFGEEGLVYAGIVNAFAMPTFVVAGVLILSLGMKEKRSMWAQMKVGLLNPVVIAAFAGILTSLVVHETALGAIVEGNEAARRLIGIASAVLAPVAAMGLPLALIAVGGSLRFAHVRRHIVLLGVCGLLKLVAAPLLTLALCWWLFPGAERAAVGTAVLLMACPVSVALYVISERFQTEPAFVAAALATTTAASCITIPLWVAVVL